LNHSFFSASILAFLLLIFYRENFGFFSFSFFPLDTKILSKQFKNLIEAIFFQNVFFVISCQKELRVNLEKMYSLWLLFLMVSFGVILHFALRIKLFFNQIFCFRQTLRSNFTKIVSNGEVKCEKTIKVE
jgi:hypothetical protein